MGQLVNHDLSFDPMSTLQLRNDPARVEDFRTPRFDLDLVYGGGPEDMPTCTPRTVGPAGMAFVLFHNRVVGDLRDGGHAAHWSGGQGELFGEAQRIVRWHYHWA